MAPRISIGRFLAFIALDRVTLAALRVGDIAHLDEHGLALACTPHRCPKEAVCTIRDGRLHRLSDHLGDEHTASEMMSRLYRHPLEVVVFYMLDVAERTRSDLERYQR